MGFLPLNLEFWKCGHWGEYTESLHMPVQERKQRDKDQHWLKIC